MWENYIMKYFAMFFLFSFLIWAQGDYKYLTHSQMWKISNNPYPEIKNNLAAESISAGDINGDGKTDYIFNGREAYVFFGNNTDEYNYDQKLPYYIYPIGDINGDGYDDAIGSSEYKYFLLGSSTGYIDTDVSPYKFLSVTEGFGDFNNDGYGDFISFNSDSEYFICLGNKDLSKVEIINGHQTELNTSYRFWDVDELNNPIFIYAYDDFSKSKTQLLLQSFSPETEVKKVIQELEFDGTSTAHVYNYYTVDFNGDKFNEILITKKGYNSFMFVKSEHPDSIYKPTPIRIKESVISIGDINADGKDDLMYEKDGNIYISYGVENFTGALSQDYKIPIEEGYNAKVIQKNNLSDYNGDSINDIEVMISSEDKQGRKIIYGDKSKNYQIKNILYEKINLWDRVRSTVNLSDLNKDGYDDFGFVYVDRDYLGVFYGGENLSNEPDLILKDKDAKGLESVTNGDFNGDGYIDIALCYSGSNSKIVIFLGSDKFDTKFDFIIDYPEDGDYNLGFTNVVAVGDVNKDKYTDLVITDLNCVWLFLGSKILTESKLELVNSQENYHKAQALGDINQDGIDDFAIFKFVSKTIEIYLGNTNIDITSLINHDLVIETDSEYKHGPISMAANGDFNNDGFNDIATLSCFRRDRGDSEIYIYYGGKDFDIHTDLKLKVDKSIFTNEKGYYSYLDLFGDIQFVEDVDGNGADELFYSSASGHTNAVLFMGNEYPDDFPALVFKAANQNASLGADNNSTVTSYEIAAGNFEGKDKFSFILPQYNDNTDAYLSTRVYKFDYADYVGIEDEKNDVVTHYQLNQNYPNPFNPETKITFEIPEETFVKLVIYNVLGQKVKVLKNEIMQPGSYTVNFDGSKLSSGVYFYKLETNVFSETKKMLLLE